MMRFFVSVLATAAIFLAATVASATTITVTVTGVILDGPNAGSTDTSLAASGEKVRVDIQVRTDGGIVNGATLAAGQAGGGLGGLTFDGGLTASEYFHSSVGAKFGEPNGGLDNAAGLPSVLGSAQVGPPAQNDGDGTFTSVNIPRSLSGADITLNGNVLFYAGFTTGAGSTGDGSAFDLGILLGSASPLGGTADVDFTGNGAAHAQLFFTVGLLGSDPIFFGTSPIDNSVTDELAQPGLIFSNSLQIGPSVIPEPATALLMGLGLGGLSLAGRRRA